MGGIKHTVEKSLQLIRGLPRVAVNNIRDAPGSRKQVILFVKKQLLSIHFNEISVPCT